MLNWTEAELSERLAKNPALRINSTFSQIRLNRSPSPRNATTVPLEEEEQAQLAIDLNLLGVRWCHVPNGGFRNIKTAKYLKRLGVKPGVPDIVIFTPPPAFPGRPGTVIEMKRQKGGVVSDEQKDWLTALAGLNWYTAVANGYVEAIKVLKICGYGGK